MHTPASVAGGKFCGEFQCCHYHMEVNNRSLTAKAVRDDTGERQQRRLRQPRNRPVGCKCPCPTTDVTAHGCARRAPSRLLLLSVDLRPQAGAGRVARSRTPEGPETVCPGLNRPPTPWPVAVPRTRTLHARVEARCLRPKPQARGWAAWSVQNL